MKRLPYLPYPAYRRTREVFDAGEASWLVAHGWTVLEHITVERWTREHHSKSTSYVLGLPKNALHDVAAISATV